MDLIGSEYQAMGISDLRASLSFSSIKRPVRSTSGSRRAGRVSNIEA